MSLCVGMWLSYCLDIAFSVEMRPIMHNVHQSVAKGKLDAVYIFMPPPQRMTRHTINLITMSQSWYERVTSVHHPILNILYITSSLTSLAVNVNLVSFAVQCILTVTSFS